MRYGEYSSSFEPQSSKLTTGQGEWGTEDLNMAVIYRMDVSYFCIKFWGELGLGPR